MSLPTQFKPIVLLAALFCFIAAPAIAADALYGSTNYGAAVPDDGTNYGSDAWTTTDVTLRDGPGNAYAVNGTVPRESRVLVDRCHVRWCQIRVGHGGGWVGLDALSFGQFPRGPFTGPKLNYQSGSGVVCFYTGANYTGQKSCATSGTVVRDLKLFGIDDSFASVTVEGAANVMVCRDFDFTSYCRRIVASEPRLERFLNRAISSYRVY
jgi:uncharacterized protein YraI